MQNQNAEQNTTPAASDRSAESEKLKDEQLTKVAGGTFTNVDDRLSHLETRTVVQTDKGAEPGQATDGAPRNGG